MTLSNTDITVIAKVLLGGIIVILNSLILVVFKRGKLSDVVHVILSHQALSDIIIGLTNMIRILYFWYASDPGFWCRFLVSPTLLSIGMASSIILMLSVQFYMSVSHASLINPAGHSKKGKVILICVWLFWIAYSFAPLAFDMHVNPNGSKQCFLVGGYVFQVYFAVFGGLNVLLWVLILYFSSRTIINLRQSMQNQKTTSNSTSDSKRKKRQLDRFIQTVKTVGVIALIFSLCIMPFNISLIITGIYPSNRLAGKMMVYFSLTIPVNSFSNIFVYAHRNIQFRTMLLNVLRRRPVENNVAEVSNITGYLICYAIQ